MESSEISEGKPVQFRERVKARIGRMNEAAEALATELGLPPQAKYDLLSVMGRRKKFSPAPTEESQQKPPKPENEQPSRQ